MRGWLVLIVAGVLLVVVSVWGWAVLVAGARVG